MGQKGINTILVIFLVANIGASGYLYTQFINASPKYQQMLDGPPKIPGKGIDHYDMTSPEAMLNSIKVMISNSDVRAAMEYLKLVMRESNDPLMKLYFVEDSQLSVEKTHVIKDSSVSDAEGKIVAFLWIRANGVDYRDVATFERQDGILVISSFYLFDWNSDAWTDEDKYLHQAMESWETSGKLP